MSEHWTVADVMTTDVIAVHEQTPFKNIARRLADGRVSAVPVIDADRRVLGVVSEGDLLRKEQFQMPWHSRKLQRRGSTVARAKAAGTTAREVMTSPAITVAASASLPAAARRMATEHVTRLVVLDQDERLVGIVSRSDLIRVFLTPDEELGERVLRHLVHYALWQDPFAVRVDVENGVVTLTGEVERRSLAVLALRLARSVDGVVDVDDQLVYVVDDTHFPPRETVR